MNSLFQKKVPFFFIVDFDGKDGAVIPLSELAAKGIYFLTPYHTNISQKNIEPLTAPFILKKQPENFESYQKKFDAVQHEIKKGNSYLINLSIETPIETNLTLQQIFEHSKAKYKLFYKNKFIHFSPETFVSITANQIHTFPMKGTINADHTEALDKILSDKKEMAEQYIITDLLRNDLSLVADNVQVKKFRYAEKVVTHTGSLFQISSHITGDLKPIFRESPGDIFEKILPAGSVTGAPKKKTLDIIRSVENHDRGFYTGIWGIFDGKDMDSCVIIRMIEQKYDKLFFKSGGGITAMSDAKTEYQEILDKIYVPIY